MVFELLKTRAWRWQMKFKTSANYLPWEEYRTRVLQLETLQFLHNTTLLSTRNFWKKQTLGGDKKCLR